MEHKNDTFILLLLPTLVLQKIAHFLDFTSLKRIRLTCKLLKSVIDSPQHIKRLKVILKNKDDIDSVINSEGTWNNYKFIISDQFPKDQELSRWTSLYGEFVKILQIEKVSDSLSSNTFSHVVNALIVTCSGVESIQITELDFTKIPPKNLPVIFQNWKNLRNLYLNQIVYISDHSRQLFSEIVASPYVLTSLNFPRLQASVNSMSSVPVALNHNEHFEFHERALVKEYEEFILNPVIEKIIRDMSQLGGSTLQTLYCPEELISSGAYSKLVNLCANASITLHYSKPSIIPSHVVRQSEVKLASECLGSIAGINELVLQKPFSKLTHIYLNRSNFLFISDGPFDIPSFPSLESIHFHFSTWPSAQRDRVAAKRLSTFITCLQSGDLTSVRSVYISRFPQSEMCSCPHANLIRPYLVLSLVNLTNLELDGVAYMPEEYIILWTTLRKLQRIKLKSCLGVNDTAMIGNYGQIENPSMLLLTDLKHLILDEVGEITKVSYKLVFSKMRLIHLMHIPRIEYPIDEAAYVALVHGCVWEHLEHFRCMGFGFVNMGEKVEFSCKFQNAYFLNMDSMLQEATKRNEKIAKDLNKKGCMCC